jgi:pimeloyl-ACP methyl ester carboxylesterase
MFGPEIPPRFVGPQTRPTKLVARTVLAGRHEFLVREAGPVDAPPIVLLHGWVYGSVATWHRMIPALADHHHVIAIELRNHGRSSRIRGRFEIEDLADDVAAVLDGLGLGSVPVMGYSMGGMTAQALARRHPMRVERLILAATAAHPIDLPRVFVDAAFFIGRGLARLDALSWPRAAWHYMTRRRVIAPEHGAWLWEELLDRDATLYYEAAFAINRFDARSWLGRLDVPTLVIIPTADQLIPARLQYETAALLKDAEVVEIAGARHEAVLTHADRVAEAVLGFVSR